MRNKQFQVPMTLHKRQKEIFDDKTRRRIVAAGRRFGKCVVGDTEITMADGSKKKISDLKQGELIVAYDEKSNSYVKRKVRRVVSNGKRMVVRVSTENRHIRCTVNHPFLTSGTWTKAERLTPRSSLTIFDGKETKTEVVTNVRWDGEEETFDIEVEGTPTFIANGIVTHNTALARAEILRAASNPGWNVWYVAPTYRMAKQIMWRDLMREIPRGWIKSANATVMDIVLKNGSVISLRGADKPDSLRGVEVNFLIMDEMQDIKPIAWEEALRPTLAKSRGRVLFLGCVTGDTSIIARDGVKRIDSYDQGAGVKTLSPMKSEVYGIDKSWHVADGFFDNGEVPTRKITTKCGYRLESSLPHPILVMAEDGNIAWKKTKDIVRGDRVAIDRSITHGFKSVDVLMQPFVDEEIKRGRLTEGSKFSQSRAYFLGLLTACGEIHGVGRVSVTTKDKNVARYLITKCTEHGEGFYPSEDRKNRLFCNSTAFVRLMKNAGISNGGPNKRPFPSIVDKMDSVSLRIFIGGLIDGAGCVHSHRDFVEYYSTEKNVRHLQLLLLRCGLISFVKRIDDSWTCFLSGKQAAEFKSKFKSISHRVDRRGVEVEKIEDVIPYQNERYKAAFGRTYSGDLQYKDAQKALRGYYHVDKKAFEELDRLVLQNYFWDEVASIEIGFAHTYDFTIPDTHSFWSNGFISHNTPKSHNYFYKLYRMGQNEKYIKAKVYKSWQIPTIESPFIPEAEIEEARADMDPRSFRQEFMACHLPDTEILLADGRKKKIKNVGIDDVLVHIQPDGKRVTCVVDAAGKVGKKRVCDIVLETGDVLPVSILHRFKVHDENGVPFEIFARNVSHLEFAPNTFNPSKETDANFVLSMYQKAVDNGCTESFFEWKLARWDSSLRLLKVRVLSKQERPNEEVVYNLTVDSADRSYLLASGINNFNSFETVTGSVYYNFNREVHVKSCPFNPNLPIWVGQDFNVSPMSSVIMQKQPNGEVWVVDEIYQHNSNTLAICNELERRYWKYSRQITIYPDPAGGSRSTARGESDLDIFRERGFRRIKYRKQHPPVADRLNAVNKVLMNADGKVILRVDPKCKNLIESLEQTVFKEGTNEVDKRLNIEHITDALGYPIEIEFPRHKIELIGISI